MSTFIAPLEAVYRFAINTLKILSDSGILFKSVYSFSRFVKMTLRECVPRVVS